MRDLITSAANPQVKRIRSLLRSRKDRHGERMFVAEGVRLVEEALGHGDPACLLYAAEQLAATPRGAALLERLERHPAAYPVHPAILRELTDVEAPQGVVAALPWPALRPRQVALALILDGVQDPGNAGTLLRSAEAAGADLVIALKGSADLWSPKVVRAGMGAHLRLALQVDLDWPAARQALGGARIYAATQGADLTYDAADWRQPAALAVGNEANGVSAATLAAAQPIAIPMLGQGESLNAAVAGSVILFEAARQRR